MRALQAAPARALAMDPIAMLLNERTSALDLGMIDGALDARSVSRGTA